MKAFITKYALTQGIQEKEGTELDKLRDESRKYFKCKDFYNLVTEGEYFFTIEEAKLDAENRRVKKISSLQKQIDRLKSLKF